MAEADLSQEDRERAAADLAGIATLSRPEVVLLVRFVAAKMVLDYLRPWFWIKFGVVLLGLALAGALWYSDEAGEAEIGAIVGFCLVVAVVLHVVQRLATRAIRRLGAHHRLEGLEPIYDSFFDWRGQLTKSLRRLGSPWKLLRAAAREGLGRDEDDPAFVAQGELVLDWRTSIPLDDLREARAILARGAGRP
jgi:hypothetical protein